MDGTRPSMGLTRCINKKNDPNKSLNAVYEGWLPISCHAFLMSFALNGDPPLMIRARYVGRELLTS